MRGSRPPPVHFLSFHGEIRLLHALHADPFVVDPHETDGLPDDNQGGVGEGILGHGMRKDIRGRVADKPGAEGAHGMKPFCEPHQGAKLGTLFPQILSSLP